MKQLSEKERDNGQHGGCGIRDNMKIGCLQIQVLMFMRMLMRMVGLVIVRCARPSQDRRAGHMTTRPITATTKA